MQALKCELCGSNDIVKQEGFFVCQHCGTKYSPAEAKKIMVEGTIKINNTDSAKNYLVLAENAIKSDNYRDAELYSNKVLEIEPKAGRAWFIKGVAVGHQNSISNIRIKESVLCFDNAIKCIMAANKLEIIDDETKNLIQTQMTSIMLSLLDASLSRFVSTPNIDLANAILTISRESSRLYKAMSEQYGFSSDNLDATIAKKVISSVNEAYDTTMLYDYHEHGHKHPSKADFEQFKSRIHYAKALLDAVLPFCDDKDLKVLNLKSKLKIVDCEYGIQSHIQQNGEWVVEYTLSDKRKQEVLNEYNELIKQIKKLDPSYEPPKAGGCYIATAIYGSYDCPQVWILRRFRDQYLLKTIVGTLFVKFYYSVSPSLVKKFGKSNWFNRICSIPIECLVKMLRANGVSGAPYRDRCLTKGLHHRLERNNGKEPHITRR